ncbi:MAG: class I SAM-dependent methyltransferase [Bryobacterales bacterium]|nr:class I SAM-dependent methyltransferase [Bryobacterales bacterium]
MTAPWQELLPLFRCPDDGGEVREDAGAGVRCVSCGRTFPLSADGRILSLVASGTGDLAGASAEYLAAYAEARNVTDGSYWEMRNTAADHRRKRSQVRQVEELLRAAGSRDLVCDFSAGPGYYTLSYARRWRHVLHCDLSWQALRKASTEASDRGLENILFVRMDYLHPPFQGSLPQVICMDSLERGPSHEQALLAAIRRSLAPGGTAVVDFHNWWHNPLRRLGLMRQNFGDNRSYGAKELPPLLAAAGITEFERFAFHQELAAVQGMWRSWVARTLPPTRWVYRFTS